MGTDVVGDGLYWVGASRDVFAHGWNLLDVYCVKLQRIVLNYSFFSCYANWSVHWLWLRYCSRWLVELHYWFKAGFHTRSDWSSENSCHNYQGVNNDIGGSSPRVGWISPRLESRRSDSWIFIFLLSMRNSNYMRFKKNLLSHSSFLSHRSHFEEMSYFPTKSNVLYNAAFEWRVAVINSVYLSSAICTKKTTKYVKSLSFWQHFFDVQCLSHDSLRTFDSQVTNKHKKRLASGALYRTWFIQETRCSESNGVYVKQAHYSRQQGDGIKDKLRLWGEATNERPYGSHAPLGLLNEIERENNVTIRSVFINFTISDVS